MNHIPQNPLKKRPRVLYVDTAVAACKLLSHVFTDRDFEFTTINNPSDALELLEKNEFHIILASYEDDGLTPVDFLRATRDRCPEALRVQISREADMKSMVHAVREASLARFIEKTWNVSDIDVAVTDLAKEARCMIERKDMERRCHELEIEVERLKEELDDVSSRHEDRALEALIAALGFRMLDARRHSYRSANYARILGRECGLDDDEARAVWQGALLHDLGKIGISDQILTKPGTLSDAEWDEMRWHPALGHGLLDGFAFLDDVRTIVLQHHERWDGGGYPAGIDGGDIAIGARICSVADSIDAMTSNRPYRSAMAFDMAWNEILRCSGSQFDPDVVDAFVGMGRETWESIIAGNPAYGKARGNGQYKPASC